MSLKLMTPINEKLSEAVLFLLKNTTSPNMGLKKLAKLLYFADFNHYKKTYESITSENYCRWEHGPFPKSLYVVMEDLEAKGLVTIEEVKYSDKIIGNKIKGIEKFKPKYLSDDEQNEILNVIKKMGTLSGKQLEDLSHEDTPWQVTDEDGFINYDLVFYRDEELVKQVE